MLTLIVTRCDIVFQHFVASEMVFLEKSVFRLLYTLIGNSISRWFFMCFFLYFCYVVGI